MGGFAADAVCVPCTTAAAADAAACARRLLLRLACIFTKEEKHIHNKKKCAPLPLWPQPLCANSGCCCDWPARKRVFTKEEFNRKSTPRPLLLPLCARGCCWPAGQCEILIYLILRNLNNSKSKFKLNCNDLISRNFNNFNLFNFEERLNRET